MTHFPSSLTRVNVEVFVSVSPVFLFLAVSFVGTVALSPREFDGNGNYTFGLTEQVMCSMRSIRTRSAAFASWRPGR